MYKPTFFEINLNHAKDRVTSKPTEAYYVHKYLRSIIHRLSKMKKENPEITEQEMKEKLFQEIDDYSTTVFEISFVFSEYIEYIANQYLRAHPDKYKELSEKLKTSYNDISKLHYSDCTSFDEYLSLYLYNTKRELFNYFFEGYMKGTPENYVNFDELLQENIKPLSSFYFGDRFSLPQVADVLADKSLDPSKKIAKMKEFSTWYKLPSERKAFLNDAKIFIYGSQANLSTDSEILENLLRKDLARSTAKTVQNLDDLGELKGFLVSEVSQLISLGFPEYALPLCEGPNANLQFLSSLKGQENWRINKSLEDVVSVDKLKTLHSEYALSSPKSMPIESLLALNSFWSNRYIKSLDTYSEGMFAVDHFDIIHKIIAGERIDISKEEVNDMLIKMNTFYRPACIFLEKCQRDADADALNKEAVDVNDANVEEKIVRFSYEPFIDLMNNRDAAEYKSTFDKMCPNSKNDIREDADWYIRLFNPIYSSYSMKDYNINSIIASIENSTNNFANAGIILDKPYDGSPVELPNIIGIGVDAGLTSPVRFHIKKSVLIDFLKSLNGNAIVPIYAGAEDFKNPDTGKLYPVHIVSPLSDKHKSIIKKASRNPELYDNPNLISHLGFLSPKAPPQHLCENDDNTTTSKSKKRKGNFVVKYLDLETGVAYTKSNDSYDKYEPTPIGGDSEHDI